METNRTAPDAGPVPGGEQGERTTDGPQAAGAGGSAPTGGARETGRHQGSTAHHGSGGHQGATGHHGSGGAGADASAAGFFAWLRRLGVPRRAGWLGGVCAGVAARLGLDPIVVRGIVVVLAVLGAPFVLVYAIAWLLLPDAEGEIHFERLLRGTVDPAVIGILVLGVVGLVPLVQGGWLGWQWWPEVPSLVVPWFGIDLGWIARVLLVLALVGGLIWLVVWLAIRSSRSASADWAATPPPASSVQERPETAPESGEDRTLGGEAAAAAAFDAAPLAPAAPATGASAEELADWRARQEAWRQSYAAWKAGQAEAARAARAQAAEENRARARELTAQADAARALRRASRPRASAAFVFTALGLALVGGAIAAIWALGDARNSGFAVPIALAVATLVLAAGMIVAALRRRRSGALAFFTMLTTVAMLLATGIAAALPAGRLVGPGYSMSMTVSDRLVQPVGDAYLELFTVLEAPEVPPRIELTQGFGTTFLSIEENDRVQFVSSDTGPVTIWTVDRDGNTVSSSIPALHRGDSVVFGSSNGTADDDEPIDAIVELRQGSGNVYVDIRMGAGR